MNSCYSVRRVHLGVWVGADDVMSKMAHCDNVCGLFQTLVISYDNRADWECNPPSILATVFYGASAFNGDLNQWNVTSVTDMSLSKSIRIVESDLRGREFMLLWLEGSVGGRGWCRGWWWWCDVKVLKNAVDWLYSPMAHCTNVCGLWQTVILLRDFLIFSTFCPLWDFLMGFHAFWPLSKTVVIK